MLRTEYDYIILGATMPGAVFAAAKARAGHSVLLTNRYGFPGGDITEQLVCLQDIPRMDDGPLSALFRAVTDDALSATVVNPESVKYGLQEYLETSGVDLCFHLLPYRINIEESGTLAVSWLAKEGTLTIRARKMLDATDALEAAQLVALPVTLGEHRINLIVSTARDETFLSFGSIRHAVRLKDGRYWISLHVRAENELFGESAAHELQEEFREVLERSGARIQLLPLGTHVPVTASPERSMNGSWSTVDGILGTVSDPHQQFSRTVALLDRIDTF